MNVRELMGFTPSHDPREVFTHPQRADQQKNVLSSSTPRGLAAAGGGETRRRRPEASSPPPRELKRQRLEASVHEPQQPILATNNSIISSSDDDEIKDYSLKKHAPPVAASGVVVASSFSEQEQISVLAKLEQLPEELMDNSKLRKLAHHFEKRIEKNQELRVRYAGQPEKFVDSECDLNDAVIDLQAVAANPELYGEFVKLGLLDRIVQLLSHENVDISGAVVSLLQELTDIDADHDESRSSAVALVQQFIQCHGLQAVLQLLQRLNEEVAEESRTVYNVLAIFENIADLQPEESSPDNDVSSAASDAMSTILIDTGMLMWLLRRIKHARQFDSNKLYATEILSIYLQNSDAIKKRFSEKDGIEVVLRQLALYRKSDPKLAEEYELVENLFNILCSILMLRSNLKVAVDAETIQLMLIMVRSRKATRGGALKVLDYVLTMDNNNNTVDGGGGSTDAGGGGGGGGRASRVFIEVLGLPAIFPLFMQPPKQYNRRTATSREMEEWCASIVCSLVRNTAAAGTEHRKRLMAKFAENGCEKIDRLLELHARYVRKVAAAERELNENQQILARESGVDAEQLQGELYLRRLDAGLFLLQRLTITLLTVYAEAGWEVAKHIDFLTKLHNKSSSTEFRNIINEYIEHLGDDDGDADGDESKQHERQRLTKLVTNMFKKHEQQQQQQQQSQQSSSST